MVQLLRILTVLADLCSNPSTYRAVTVCNCSYRESNTDIHASKITNEQKIKWMKKFKKHLLYIFLIYMNILSYYSLSQVLYICVLTLKYVVFNWNRIILSPHLLLPQFPPWYLHRHHVPPDLKLKAYFSLIIFIHMHTFIFVYLCTNV